MDDASQESDYRRVALYWAYIATVAITHCGVVAVLYVSQFAAPFAIPFAVALLAYWLVLLRSPFIDLPRAYRRIFLLVPAFIAAAVSFCVSAIVAIIASGRGT